MGRRMRGRKPAQRGRLSGYSYSVVASHFLFSYILFLFTTPAVIAVGSPLKIERFCRRHLHGEALASAQSGADKQLVVIGLMLRTDLLAVAECAFLGLSC